MMREGHTAWQIIGLAMIPLIVLAMAIVCYLYFLDENPPLVMLNAPVPTNAASYTPGDKIILHVHEDVRSQAPSLTQYKLVGVISETPYSVTFIRDEPPKARGDFEDDLMLLVMPDTWLPGQYKLKAESFYQVNAFSRRSVKWETQPFDILPKPEAKKPEPQIITIPGEATVTVEYVYVPVPVPVEVPVPVSETTSKVAAPEPTPAPTRIATTVVTITPVEPSVSRSPEPAVASSAPEPAGSSTTPTPAATPVVTVTTTPSEAVVTVEPPPPPSPRNPGEARSEEVHQRNEERKEEHQAQKDEKKEERKDDKVASANESPRKAK